MASNQEAESLEKTLETTLEKTDFGHMINENKRPILIIGAIILLLIIGYSVMDTVQSNKKVEHMENIFKVEDSVFNAYLEGKTTADAFKTAFAGISNEFMAEPNLVPVMLQAMNKLEEAKGMDNATLDKIGMWLNKMDKKNYLYLFTALRMAAIYENHAQVDKGIAILSELIANKGDFMLDQVHFSLGRLYKIKGDTAAATKEFQAVVDMQEDSEFKNMAKIYLSELKQ